MTGQLTAYRPGPVADTARPAGHVEVRAVLVTGALAVLGLWWVDTPAGTLTAPGGVATAAGRVAGLLGAYLVLVQLLLLARIPWFERAVGFDRLAGWHRGLGTNVVLLLVAHVLLVTWGYSTHGPNPVLEFYRIVTTYPDMLPAAIGMLLFLAVAMSSARSARRRLSYEAWYWLHVTTYLAVALSFFHQVSAGADFLGHAPQRVLWFGLYGSVAAGVVAYRVVRPVQAWSRHRLVVHRVVEEGPGVSSVWIAGRRLGELDAHAGQFFTWRFLARGHWASAHPYSLSAAPRPGLLRITVKALGDHSADLAGLRPGTRVLAEGPFGHFTAAAAAGRGRVLLIAGGAGIGPIRALAEEFALAGRDVVVAYRASRAADLALGRELAELASGWGVQVHWLVGRRAELGYDPLAPDALRALVPDIARRHVYVCGPPGLTAAVRRALHRLRVPRDRIHDEEFTLR